MARRLGDRGCHHRPEAFCRSRSMTPFVRVSGIAAPLPRADVDTDAVLSFAAAQGQGAVAGLSFHSDGSYSFNPGNGAYQQLAAGATQAVEDCRDIGIEARLATAERGVQRSFASGAAMRLVSSSGSLFKS